MIVNSRNLLGHTTGVQRYTQRIIDELVIKDIDFSEVKPRKNISGIKGHLWEQFILPYEIVKHNNNILWSPCNTGPLCIKNQIVTIHDTVPFDHPEWLNRKFVEWYRFIQPKLVRNVKHIITISEFSKQKIIEHLKVSEDKVSVIYNGVDLSYNFKSGIPSPVNIHGNYFLSVGSLEPRKNINRLIEAFIKFKMESKSNIKLVIVGKKGVGRVFKKSELIFDDDIIYTGYVSDSELDCLYKNALGFCYPSLYEGFGLPPLEAMLYGIPVLTSDNSAMKELCKGRAILVNPSSIDDISHGLSLLVNNTITKSQLESNVKFAKSLSWAKCANETSNILLS